MQNHIKRFSLLKTGIFIEIRTQVDHRFYYYVYTNITQFIQCDVNWINGKLPLFNSYTEAFDAALESALREK